MKDERFVSLYRSAQGIQLVTCRRIPIEGAPRYEVPLYSVQVEERPLILTDKLPFGAAPETLRCWDRLKAAERFDSAVLADVITICLRAVLWPGESDCSIPPLELAHPEPEFQPTAANPRAYRGTKDRPPKPKRPPAQNLALQLCSVRTSEILLGELWCYRAEARSELIERGFSEKGIDRLFALARAPQNLFLQYHFEGLSLSETVRFPEQFVRCYLSSLSKGSYEDLRKLLGMCHQLSLLDDEKLGGIAIYLTATFPIDSALAWLLIFSEQDPSIRGLVADKVIQSAPLLKGASDDEIEQIAEALRLISGFSEADSREKLIKKLFETATSGRSVAYFIDGLRILREFDVGTGEIWGSSWEYYPVFLLAKKIFYRFEYPHEQGGTAMELWRSCARVPARVAALDAIEWSELSEIQIDSILTICTIELDWWTDDKSASRKKHAFIARHISDWIALIKKLSDEIVPRATDAMKGLVGSYSGKSFSKLWSECLSLAARIGIELTRNHEAVGEKCATFLNHDDETVQRAPLAAPSRTLHILQKASRLHNTDKRIRWGIARMLAQQPDLTTRTFLAHTNKLCRTAKEIGTLNHSLGRQVVCDFAGHRLLDNTFSQLGLRELVTALLGERALKSCNIIPRVAREYAAGTRELTDTQIYRHRIRILDKLDLLRLQELELIATDRLGRGFGEALDFSTARHALRLLRSADYNKKILRRFIREYFQGRSDFLVSHPLTKRWIAERPTLPLDIWTGGTCLSGLVREKPVHLTLEKNPWEVLKLGEYVGTCLGLGGICSDSSPAILADINKQVIYARDDAGTVVGRQILALSDDNQLVAFHVYPWSAPAELKLLFQQYDRQFAEKLGVPIWSEEEHDQYKIENILSENWWDDHAWDLKIEDDAEA